MNPNARVVIVGITPGPTQMLVAYRQAWLAMLEEVNQDDVCARAKGAAAFGGMRTRLCEMLDYLGIPPWLGLASSSDLFGDGASGLLETTSAVRYPVFYRGKPYRGQVTISKNPLLRYLHEELAEDLSQVPNALVIPLGKIAAQALVRLASDGLVDEERCLAGLPHPSGANGHYAVQWHACRENCRHKAREWFATH